MNTYSHAVHTWGKKFMHIFSWLLRSQSDKIFHLISRGSAADCIAQSRRQEYSQPPTAAESIFAGFRLRKEQNNSSSPQETAMIKLMLINSTCQRSSANTLVLLILQLIFFRWWLYDRGNLILSLSQLRKPLSPPVHSSWVSVPFETSVSVIGSTVIKSKL